MRMTKMVVFAIFFASLSICLGLAQVALPQAQTRFDQLVRQSSYIFSGTVKKVRASTLGLLPASDRTVVVQVDAVLHAPKTLADYTGREVTVELHEASSVKQGQRLTFFTNGGLFGEGVALEEVGHLVPTAAEGVKSLRARIADALHKKTDEDLGRRMATAELVVVGKVLKTQAAKLPERGPVTEHDPEWWEAKIQIESVEKGQYSAQTVPVLYATSLDSLWYRAPKLKPGQEGIFVLHKNEVKWPGIENSYTLVDPLDLQPSRRREQVRQILKGIL